MATDKADVVSIGHSLGGGLAQHFAYSLPPTSQDGTEVPRVSRVYAFDPSPVTGWLGVPRHLREQNAANMQIERIFEHGEALAYIRLMQSYVVRPSEAAPAIWEIRYNLIRTANVFSNGSMLLLACHLATATSSANSSVSRKQRLIISIKTLHRDPFLRRNKKCNCVSVCFQRI